MPFLLKDEIMSRRNFIKFILPQIILLIAISSIAAQRGKYGETLIEAVFPNDNIETVKSLIAKGADVNAKEKYTGRTAIFYAVSSGNEEMVRILLEAGANPNAKDNTNETALMSCYSDCTAKIVQMMVAKGADVNIRDKDGDTALIGVSVFENADALQALINAGADVNAKNNKGVTALMRAAKDQELQNIKVLLASGADVNAQDEDGWTALTYAQKNKDNKIIQALETFQRAKQNKANTAEAFSQINAIKRCEENSDSLYNRREVLEKLATILNDSAPGYENYERNGFYVNDDDRPRYFFVYDLTDLTNKGTSLSCVDFKNNHVYHFAAHYIPFSFSHIVILEGGNLKVFRAINCENSKDKLGDVIVYLNQKLKDDTSKDKIISRVKDYRKYGSFVTVDDTYIRCKER